MRALSEEQIPMCSEFLFSTELGKTYYPVESFLEQAVSRAYHKKQDRIFLAFRKEKLVGVIWYVTEGAFYNYPYLHMIAVEESSRGQGYGTQMLAFMEDKILEQKLTNKVYLVVDEKNHNARTLYRYHGYQNVGKMEGLFRKGINEMLMEKVLTRMTKISLDVPKKQVVS